MKKDFIEITKTKKLSKSKDNKTYNILKNRIIGKIKSKNSNANHHNTFTQKKFYKKQNMIILKQRLLKLDHNLTLKMKMNIV